MKDDISGARALMATLSDDLALPLVQIKTTLELLDGPDLNKKQQELVQTLGVSTEMGLQLVEAYRLALSLADTTELPLEPVAIGAVLSEAAHQLAPLAQRYNTDIWVDVQPRLKPALAHRPSLLTALACLGGSLIRAEASERGKKRGRILLGAHRFEGNTLTGVFSSSGVVTKQALRAARGLSGTARQPMTSVPAGTASGVLIADLLCARIWQPLVTARHQNMPGLATVVPISQQLNLV